MGFCPCATLFSNVTLKNDSDISVVVTAVVAIRCRCYWAIFRLIPHGVITHVTGTSRGRRRRAHGSTGEPQKKKKVYLSNSCQRSKKLQPTHLQVKELAVASVDDLCAAIAPGHFDDVDLVKTRDRVIQTLTWKERPSDNDHDRSHRHRHRKQRRLLPVCCRLQAYGGFYDLLLIISVAYNKFISFARQNFPKVFVSEQETWCKEQDGRSSEAGNSPVAHCVWLTDCCWPDSQTFPGLVSLNQGWYMDGATSIRRRRGCIHSKQSVFPQKKSKNVTSHQNNCEGWKHGTIDHVYKNIIGCLQGASEDKVLR